MKEVLFKLSFSALEGCPEGVLMDMLRHDGQRLVSWHKDGAGFRWVVVAAEAVRGGLGWRYAPTMGRWASFWLGARLVETLVVEV